jgi:acetyl-CoA carboxylase biotin carboxyl carrier protein
MPSLSAKIQFEEGVAGGDRGAKTNHRVTQRGRVERDHDLEEVREEEETFTFTAPLLGTFYSRPTPEEEPFVHPGGTVKVGDTLCVIEAMKVMNEINAEVPGRVKEILVKDGEGVEYGQPLFRFEKA